MFKWLRRRKVNLDDYGLVSITLYKYNGLAGFKAQLIDASEWDKIYLELERTKVWKKP